MKSAPVERDDEDETLIEVMDFHKAYRETWAVTGLSFVVHPGEILGLVGPNGAGKTTTLRAIAGIIPASRGDLRVAGWDVARSPVRAKRALAYVPDDPSLFDALTVWEHLEFVAAAYRVANFPTKAQQLLERLELLDKRDTLATELSRGMRQKVAIACAYLHDPKALLFDEPHTGLDPHGIRRMKTSIRDRSADGAAIIVSSHLLTLVEDICSHLLILDHGLSRFFGTMDAAREAFGDLRTDTSLEEIFFRATRGEADSADPASTTPTHPQASTQQDEER